VTGGALDHVPIDKIREVEEHLLQTVNEQLPELCGRIEAGKKLEMTDRDHIMDKIKPAILPFEEVEETNANN
jgi:F-type H+-transporting ATPase subunit alpha